SPLSIHARVAVGFAELCGFVASAKLVSSAARNLPQLTLTAVLPFPKRSKEALTRGAKSVQQGTHDTGAKSRAGTYVPAGKWTAGTQAFRESTRRPPFTV